MSTKSDAATCINTMTKFRCALDLVRYGMGDGRELVYAPQAALSHILAAQEVQLLQHLAGFATLEEHAITACRQLGFAPARVIQVRDQLTTLAERQLLVSETALKELLLKSSGSSATRQISTLAIQTRNNSQSLHRCLKSYADCSSRHERSMRFVVVDDSHAAQAAENLDLTKRVAAGRRSEIFYADRQDKETYALALAQQSQVPLDIVRFAMICDEYPASSGANRNALLLSSVGELAAQVDDDTLCLIAPSPGKKGGLALTSEYTPSTLWCGPPSEPPAEPDSTGFDFFRAHELLLGKTFASLVTDYASELDLAGLKYSFIKHLHWQSSVAITSLGATINQRLPASELLLRLDGEARGRLTSSEQNFSTAIRGGHTLENVARATVSNESFSTGSSIGLDNDQLLPPFVPVQHNQEKCFASLLQTNSRACYFGFLPWTLARLPDILNRSPRLQEISLNAGDIVFALLRSFQPIAGAEAELSLRRLGEYLIDWGSAPLLDFEQEIKRITWIQASARIDRFEWLLQKHAGQPAYWADAVRVQCNSLKAALTEENYLVPFDFAEVFGADAARTLVQKLVFQLGQLLVSWTQLRRAASELRNNGFVFGRRV